jgi:hypothetical protein
MLMSGSILPVLDRSSWSRKPFFQGISENIVRNRTSPCERAALTENIDMRLIYRAADAVADERGPCLIHARTSFRSARSSPSCGRSHAVWERLIV